MSKVKITIDMNFGSDFQHEIWLDYLYMFLTQFKEFITTKHKKTTMSFRIEEDQY